MGELTQSRPLRRWSNQRLTRGLTTHPGVELGPYHAHARAPTRTRTQAAARAADGLRRMRGLRCCITWPPCRACSAAGCSSATLCCHGGTRPSAAAGGLSACLQRAGRGCGAGVLAPFRRAGPRRRVGPRRRTAAACALGLADACRPRLPVGPRPGRPACHTDSQRETHRELPPPRTASTISVVHPSIQLKSHEPCDC